MDFKSPPPNEVKSYSIAKMDVPCVLICSHTSRDPRCGIMAPLLQREFLRHCGAMMGGYAGAHRPTSLYPSQTKPFPFRDLHAKPRHPNVSTISHIGGHAFAGNVIIYIPPLWCLPTGEVSPLAGRGIWYGRVEPKHVEGICKETIVGGRVIKELFRGGIGQENEILRL